MKIVVQEPWWGAWSRFSWAKGIWGVGLDSNKVKNAIKKKQKLEVHIKYFGSTFTISPTRVRNYAEENNTIFMAGKAKRKTKLYVIPYTKLVKKKIV